MPSETAEEKTITFVTGNPNKLEEFRAILGSQFPHRVVSRAIDLPEYQGPPEDVTRMKCRQTTLVWVSI